MVQIEYPGRAPNAAARRTRPLGGWLLAPLALLGLRLPAVAQVEVFRSGLEDAAGFAVVADPGAEASFGFDYGALGIPPAPGAGDGSSTGLRLAANVAEPEAPAVVAVAPQGVDLPGSYTVQVDFWINVNGPFPAGGAGSTEFIGAAVGFDPAGAPQNGAALLMSGDGGSFQDDYRLYKDAAEQDLSTGQYAIAHKNNFESNLVALLPGRAPPAAQQATFPQQRGELVDGTPGFGWHTLVVRVDGAAGTAAFSLDGLVIGTVDAGNGDPVALAGTAALVYADFDAGVSDNPELSFGVFDNFVLFAGTGPTAAFEQEAPFPPFTGEGASTAGVRVVNHNAGPLTVSALRLAGPGAGDFSVLTAVPFTLAAGGETLVEIAFDPSPPNGLREAELEVESDDATAPLLRLPLVARRAVVTPLASPFEADMDDGAGWTVTGDADTAADFGFDYGALGIPPAPHTTDGSTTGLRLAANLENGEVAAVSASPAGFEVGGRYRVRADLWVNANGPFPGGGAGSTEFAGAAVGFDPALGARNGAALLFDGEGGSGRDLRLYRDLEEQPIGGGAYAIASNDDATSPELAARFPPRGAPAAQVAAHPGQSGTLGAGTLGLLWHTLEVEVDARAGSATFFLDGLEVGTLENGVDLAPVNLIGGVALTYFDPFDSISDNPEMSFAVFDNLRVEQINFTAERALDFPAPAAAGDSATFVVENVSSAPLEVLGMRVEGLLAGRFTVVEPGPLTVAAGEIHEVEVRFEPGSGEGLYAAELLLQTADGSRPEVVFPLRARTLKANGLVAHLPLDEGPGARAAADVSGNGFDALLRAGGGGSVSPGVRGLAAGRGLRLSDGGGDGADASAGFLEIPAASGLPGLASLTVSLWVEIDLADVGSRSALFSKTAGAPLDPFGFLGAVEAADYDFHWGIGGDADNSALERLDGLDLIPPDKVRHVVLTHADDNGDGAGSARSRLWVNGLLVAEGPAVPRIGDDTPAAFQVGALQGALGLSGILDDVQVYRRELTGDEVGFLFAHPGVALPAADLADDPDADGLTNDVEGALGTDPANPDSDGDGFRDGVEVAAGTAPLDPLSRFTTTASAAPGGGVALTWPSVPGSAYRVEVTADPTGAAGWQTLALVPAAPAPAAVTTFAEEAVPTEAPARLYRVVTDPR